MLKKIDDITIGILAMIIIIYSVQAYYLIATRNTWGYIMSAVIGILILSLFGLNSLRSAIERELNG